MNTLIPIDASRARNDFFKLLDRVRTHGDRFIIKKAGIPMAEISKPGLKDEKNIMKFAGAWKDLDTDTMIEDIYTSRKDTGKLIRTLPPLE